MTDIQEQTPQQIYWPGVALSKRIELAFCCMNQGRSVEYSSLLAKTLRECAKATALANDPLTSPLLELCKEKLVQFYPPIRLGWCFERDYWINHSEIDPYEYFNIGIENGFLSIESKKVAGGNGWLSLSATMVHRVFRLVENYLPDDFDSWADDNYPIGGQCKFMVRESSETPYENGLVIDPDTHPSRGSLYFGDRSQETKQLAAFCLLKPIALQLLSESKPSPHVREMAAQRVLEYRKHSRLSFMPDSGFCYRCDRDVSKCLPEKSKSDGYDPTGCPLCGASWCD